MAALTNNITERWVPYLSKEDALLFCIDNYREYIDTKHQRAKHSSGTMDGTNEIVHCIRPFTDTLFDGQHVELTYTADQVQPLPKLMRHYEEMTDISAADFFEKHNQQIAGIAPDMEGSRCREYHHQKNNARWINQVARVLCLGRTF